MSEGRNDPCPCGSGIKFKKCHGADRIISEPERDVRDALEGGRTRLARLRTLDLPEGSAEAEYRELQAACVLATDAIVNHPDAPTPTLEVQACVQVLGEAAAVLQAFDKGGRTPDEWMRWFQLYTHEANWGSWHSTIEAVGEYCWDEAELKDTDAYRSGLPEIIACIAASKIITEFRDKGLAVWQSGQADRVSFDDLLTDEVLAARDCMHQVYARLIDEDDE